MPHGDRTGPISQGSEAGRGLGYCTGSDSPGYTKGVPAGAGRRSGENKSGGRKSGFGGGRGRGYGRNGRNGRNGRGLRCRRASEFGGNGESAARGTSQGCHYPALSQSRAGSEADFLENRIKLLKQELETLSGKFKALSSQGSSAEE
ncbi:hypothetical protein FTO70_16990 [Methanosarcina sp. KYL-1]|uniref:DUF5320 domain-containing protein n=1 Tax=Methanosarcina sp. KYL-1 TaxID=2602068 RepID=UPI0021015BE5|nr:DUF5320 domain-containing protein [Methanosarcina sp. KYL-1]MCQ1537334.1 hypothetical protein [Methanosarcina sp. KYL-1]